MINISIVIPVHNEQENVFKLSTEIERAFSHADFDWEVIWVNDSSSDQTLNQLNKIAGLNPRQKILSFTKKLGQSAAVLNGIMHAKHNLIGTLDGDGQNHPIDLISMKRLLEESCVVLVQGVRVNRKENRIRLLSTSLANSVRRFVLKDSLSDVGCAVRVFRKEIIEGMPAFKGWHRFLPVIVSFAYPGLTIEHPVSHRERLTGVSKYGVWDRLWVGIFDLIGMIWFKRRMIEFQTLREVQWQITSILSVSQVKSFSRPELRSNGLQVNAQINQ